MAKFFPAIDDAHRAFIEAQPMYFVATAAPDGRVNLSPKGYDSLRILGPNRVAWSNLTGSGNETAAHLAVQDRITVMFMSTATRPMIMRLFGRARALHRADSDWADLRDLLPRLPGARQIIDMQVETVQTSCGYGVPLMRMTGERDTLLHWAEDKGEDGVRTYWRDRNATSIDGLPTGINKAL
ncbi:pyridoxamine 5'-phosphate oxidase family protein [Paracoccus suum]|uniref:Pyridoxamine 5'-phosphate oxidase family protein n=1 Tax=Paracoccus suum TaxID=2259340 RepID=A0A344PG09_9RHOB|nr:pyridoxamine 5'-phosphate oxidase family protein [Paracoccus suum]AXC48314.1 pyridoxamine 5'-phosphate oxidase family protein [Paracoccus suum]